MSLPARTLSPTRTVTSTASAGRISSVRDPSLIIPNFSPRVTVCPGLSVQTIRRASMPEICRTANRRGGRVGSLEADPHEFVALGAFRPHGVEELARMVVHFDDAAGERRAVDVDVEDRQEDADANGRAADEVVVRRAA